MSIRCVYTRRIWHRPVADALNDEEVTEVSTQNRPHPRTVSGDSLLNEVSSITLSTCVNSIGAVMAEWLRR